MLENSAMGDRVDCYSVARISIGRSAVVSQYCFLCSASHDSRKQDLPLISAPITIGASAWITADVFVAPGVAIGDGALVTARSTVLTDIPPWTIASGNPAQTVKARELSK